jgi:hypothetical protein
MKINRRNFLGGIAGVSLAVPSAKSLAAPAPKFRAGEIRFTAPQFTTEHPVFKFGFFKEGKLVKELYHELDVSKEDYDRVTVLGKRISPSWLDQTFECDEIKLYIESMDHWVSFHKESLSMSNDTITLQPSPVTGLVRLS